MMFKVKKKVTSGILRHVFWIGGVGILLPLQPRTEALHVIKQVLYGISDTDQPQFHHEATNRQEQNLQPQRNSNLNFE